MHNLFSCGFLKDADFVTLSFFHKLYATLDWSDYLGLTLDHEGMLCCVFDTVAVVEHDLSAL